MTTATLSPSRALTADEIRAHVEANVVGSTALAEELVNAYTATVHYIPADERADPASYAGPWDDLRPSEAERLDEVLAEAVRGLEAEFARMLLDRVTKAALAFAAEYPDAPRTSSA